MMHMTFYWGRDVTLLFDTWSTKTWLGYALSLLACVLASAFYQCLETLRLRLKLAAAKTASSGSEADPLIRTAGIGEKKKKKWSSAAARVAGAVLFGVNSGVGYLLMLAVMSFNGGVFLAVVLGLAVGYMCFRSGEDENLTPVDNPCACA